METKEPIINDENDEDNQIKVEINDKARSAIYICLILIATFSSCDGGIIPQQKDYLTSDFNPNNQENNNINDNNSLVGFFGSVDYIGRVVGALIFAAIMGKMNRKILLVSTLIFKALTLFIALIPQTGSLSNIIARGFSGISQVFYTSYLPVWCDQYGVKSQRAIMVTLVQLGNPIGIIIGYGLGVICEKIMISTTQNNTNKIIFNGWRLAFGVEGIILIICGIIIWFFSDKYFSCNFVLISDNEGKEEEIKDKSINLCSILSNFKEIIKNWLFLFTTLSNCVAFFGMSIIQYWGDNYMDSVLGMSGTVRFFAFSGLCLLGPICGMVFGGLVCSKLGGYNKKNSMVFIIILSLIASIISSTIAIHKNKVMFVVTCWSFLFFICATIPPESGIIISSLENRLRGDGFSLCNSILNLIGSFPASYVYSLISDGFVNNLTPEEKVNNEHFRYAWNVCMVYNYVGLIFVIIAGVFRFKIKEDLSNEDLNDDIDNLVEEEKTNNANEIMNMKSDSRL